MKFTDLNPRFLSHGGEGVWQDGKPLPYREAVGVTFDCPCGCGVPLAVLFRNPVDGGAPITKKLPTWERTGDDFETMTLSPSILRTHGCGWHGWVRNGEIVAC